MIQMWLILNNNNNNIILACKKKITTKTIKCLGLYVLVCLLSFLLLSRLWDIECGACLRVLEGHEELVRCIRFDNKRIVSGAYDGSVLRPHAYFFVYFYCLFFFDSCCHVSVCSKIKVWDLQAALDPRAPASTLCLRTLVVSV